MTSDRFQGDFKVEGTTGLDHGKVLVTMISAEVYKIIDHQVSYKTWK